MAEKKRRNEENTILDQCIQMFIDRVSVIDAGLRNKVDDHQDDGKFQNSDIARSADAAYAKDSGNLAANVAAEAGF